MKTILTILVILFITYTGLAQIAPDKYFVQFTDKNNSPYTISNPSEFLTQRALDRRDRFDIPISMNDIPVNPSYLQGVADVGVELRNPSRWLNGVTIFTTNDSLLTVIESLPYVSNTLKIGSTKSSNSSKFNNLVRDEPIRNEGLKSTSTMDYGLSYGQIDQLNGIDLHDKGYKGEGMVIAVLDAGFTGVLEHPVFEYLRNNNKILGTKDFVYKDGDVYVGHEHGSMVLSCMAAYLPEEMIGTSPEADYWLLRSEEAPLENIIEEYNWVSAAEFADSVGADVINSSLSYFDFDMPEWSYDYSEMDGNTAISTIGADIASSKGMIVCNSAGNSGYLVGAPADGDSVMTVGAVDINGDRAGFSSIGPTADGRIKPNVMACGAGATIAVGTSGISTNGYGTSFSSPILAGMITCLWQSHPEMSALEVMESVMESGSFATAPDNYMGWGIPDFSSADSILTSINPLLNLKSFVSVGPSPFKNQLQIIVDTDSSEFINLELINLAGNTIMKMGYEVSRLNNNIIINSGLTGLPQGVYFLKVISKTKAQTVKLLKG
jgi:serine protease AprX